MRYQVILDLKGQNLKMINFNLKQMTFQTHYLNSKKNFNETLNFHIGKCIFNKIFMTILLLIGKKTMMKKRTFLINIF